MEGRSDGLRPARGTWPARRFWRNPHAAGLARSPHVRVQEVRSRWAPAPRGARAAEQEQQEQSPPRVRMPVRSKSSRSSRGCESTDGRSLTRSAPIRRWQAARRGSRSASAPTWSGEAAWSWRWPSCDEAAAAGFADVGKRPASASTPSSRQGEAEEGRARAGSGAAASGRVESRAPPASRGQFACAASSHPSWRGRSRACPAAGARRGTAW